MTVLFVKLVKYYIGLGPSCVRNQFRVCVCVIFINFFCEGGGREGVFVKDKKEVQSVCAVCHVLTREQFLIFSCQLLIYFVKPAPTWQNLLFGHLDRVTGNWITKINGQDCYKKILKIRKKIHPSSVISVVAPILGGFLPSSNQTFSSFTIFFFFSFEFHSLMNYKLIIDFFVS